MVIAWKLGWISRRGAMVMPLRRCLMLHIFSSFITFWIKATKETRVDRKEFDDVANIKRFEEYWVYAKINNDFWLGVIVYIKIYCLSYWKFEHVQWTKGKYAYLNQPAMETMDKRRRPSTYMSDTWLCKAQSSPTEADFGSRCQAILNFMMWIFF